MDSESTDKTILEINEDVPNIVERYSETITTDSTTSNYYGTWAYKTTSYTSKLLASGQNDWDVFIKDSSGQVFACPITLDVTFGTITNSLQAFSYIDKSGDKLRINLTVQKLSGSTSDTYTIYYVIYSTKITDDSIL
tara:strand:+ start:1056 stop:1466 length:411 start_codon:yes stop_codon:yes gene_type:complete